MLTSAVITAIAVVVVFVWPEFAFNYLMSIATIAGIINWTMIMFTEMKFRKVVAAGGAPEDSELAGKSGKEALDAIHFKLPFAKVTPWVVLAFLALVVVLMCFSASYRVAVIAGVIRYDFPALSSMIRGCCRRERGRPMTADRNQAGYTDASGAHGAGLVVMWVQRGRPDSSEPAATGKPS